MRRAVNDIAALPSAELMNYVVVGVTLTSALWDAAARRALLERAAAAARDAGALQVLDTTLWIMSLAELKGGTPRAAGERIAQVRELRRAIGYDAEQVVNPAYLAWNGAPRAQVQATSDAGLAMGFGGVHSAGMAALAVRDLAEGHYRDAYARLRPLVDEPFLHVTPLEYADFVEAAVRAGHVAEAEPYVQRLAELARANGSPWARAMAERSRALVDTTRSRATRRPSGPGTDGPRGRARPHPPALRRVAAPPQAPARCPRAAAHRVGPPRAQRGPGLRGAGAHGADRDRARGRVGQRAASPRPDAAGADRGAVRCRGEHERRDRRDPLHQRQHGGLPPAQGLPEARHRLTPPARRPATPPGLTADRDGIRSPAGDGARTDGHGIRRGEDYAPHVVREVTRLRDS